VLSRRPDPSTCPRPGPSRVKRYAIVCRRPSALDNPSERQEKDWKPQHQKLLRIAPRGDCRTTHSEATTNKNSKPEGDLFTPGSPTPQLFQHDSSRHAAHFVGSPIGSVSERAVQSQRRRLHVLAIVTGIVLFRAAGVFERKRSIPLHVRTAPARIAD
jgi:hypothetical protein